MHNIIKELESDNSRLFKEGVIMKEIANNNVNFFSGCRLALDPMITFGVKQVPQSKKDGPGLAFAEFVGLASQLRDRELTGHDARDAIEETMNEATVDEWNNWYRRILIKDLKCGVSEKTINNVVKKTKRSDLKIPTFNCMLAHDSANHEKKMIGKKFLDYKLDGVRVITIILNGVVTMYSRNGKQFINFGHIETELENLLGKESYEGGIVLDGEMVSSSFQALMKQVHRKDNVEATDAQYALFDILPLDEFQKGVSTLGCRARHKQLLETIPESSDNMFVVEKIECDLDTAEGQKIFSDYNKVAIDKGFEGIMIKDVDALYECKRSHFMLKAKPFIEVSLKIVDTEEGTGRNVGKLGALICEGKDDGKFIKVNVGSGLSDDQRDSFWAVKDTLIGEIAEVRADAITQNQDSDDYSLRFPRFKTFRGFKVGEKF
jgi:DNA ligase-1|tara:strand:+ start:277 stop:1578 length:1302 start_codon:yes stop_codon:yes gene_type:complete